MNWMGLPLALLLMQAPAAQTPASISGFVVKLGSNEPLSKATVVLNRVVEGGRGPAYTASSSSDGRFTFTGVAPGKYRLAVSRNGFVTYEYGARSPSRPGLPITIVAGQRVDQVVLPLMPAGTITGRVFDRDGEPLPYVLVQALKYSYQDGQRVPNVVQSAITNDLGEYRLFWLAPGQYFVGTTYEAGQRGRTGGAPNRPVFLGPRGTGGGVESVEVDENEARIPIYYPGTPDPQAAAPINLQAGVLFSGVDLTVATVRTFNVSGQVINGTTGQPVANANVVLEPRQRPGSRSLILRSRNNGSNKGGFNIGGVVPGSYDLVAIQNDRNNRMSGRVPIEVAASDLQNVTVVMSAGFSLPGRISTEGTTEGLSRIRILLRPSESGIQFGGVIPAAPVQADGTFTLQQVGQDTYRVTVNVLPRNSYVKTARLGATDLLKEGLRIDRPPSVPLEIVISSNTGTVDATVLNERQEPSINTIVVLVPDPGRRYRTDFYRFGSTDATGKIHLEGVPPGDYKAFAWEDVENGAWQDEDFIRQYEERGKPLRVSENATADIDLRVTPP